MKNNCAWCSEEANLIMLTAKEKDEMIYGAWICKECLDSIKEMADQIKYYMGKRRKENE